MSRDQNRNACPLMAEAIDLIRSMCPDPKAVRVLHVKENGTELGKRPTLPADQFEISAETYLDACERIKQRNTRR
jgi:hypothetical protein